MSGEIDIFADLATDPQPTSSQPAMQPRSPDDFRGSIWMIVSICLIVFIGFKFLLSFDHSSDGAKPLSDRYDLIVIDNLEAPNDEAAVVMAADKFWADLKQNHGMDWRFYDLNKSEEIQGTKLQKQAKEIGEPVIVVQEKSGEVLYCEKMQGTTEAVRKQIGKWLK
jgi:hypothetical protein